jgi:hypothetical protein
MKTGFSRHSRLVFLATLAAACAFAPELRADWGGPGANRLRGRSPQMERARHEIERHPAFYWARFYPGLVVGALPAGYVQASVGITGYYYYDGVYFRPTTEGTYTVVAAPVGAVVPQLPNGAEAFVLGPSTYYYAGGAFYLQVRAGFAVVPAPPGVTVTGLPAGAAPAVFSGVVYYVAGTTYFLPVTQAGATVYVTVRP